MRIYLAGPMRGIPEFNFPAFHAAAAKLRADGHVVFSPAEADTALFGVVSSPDGNEETFAQEQGKTPLELRRLVFGHDFAWICAEADAVALLPGWAHSRGALAEKAAADALGLEIIYV